MRHLVPLFFAFALIGCNGVVEQRRLHTLDRMDYGGGTEESKRVQQLIVKALKQSDATSLRSPDLVNVTMRVVPNDLKQGSLGVDWISAQPGSDGIRILFSDGSSSGIPFDDIEIAHNEKEAKTIVVFSGNPFAERDHPAVWKKLLADPDAKVSLVKDSEMVSNQQSINRVEFGG